MLSSFPLLVFARRHNFIVGTAMAAVEEPHRVDQFPQGSRRGSHVEQQVNQHGRSRDVGGRERSGAGDGWRGGEDEVRREQRASHLRRSLSE